MPRRRSQPPTAPPEENAATPAQTRDQLVQQVRSLLAEAQALSARLAAFNEIAVAMQDSLNAEATLQTMVRQARWVLDFQHCGVVLREPGGFRYRPLHGAGTLPGSNLPGWQPTGALARVVEYEHPQVLHDLGPADAPPDMHSAIVVPLRDDERSSGALTFYTNARSYTFDDLRIAYALALQVAAALRNARLYADVKQTRDELSTVLESIGDGVLVLDQRGRIVLANGALGRMLKLSSASLAGRRAVWLLRVTDEHGRRLIDGQEARALFAADRGETPGQAVLNLADSRLIEWACAPLVAKGGLPGYVVTFRDITARSEVERLRDDMFHMLVHDLRSPLGGLLMGFELLERERDSGSTDHHGETIERMHRITRSLLKRVDTTLEINRLEAGRIILQRQPTHLHLLADQALTALAPLARERRHMVVLDVPRALPIMEVDAVLLQRVFENLIGNALKFTSPGGAIRVGAKLAANEIEVVVQDNGPGIPNDYRGRIFAKYERIDGRGSGTGLGLAFCKLVIEAHNGAIGVRPAPTGGSIFWFTVPLAYAMPPIAADQ